jgi:hypothetical protein
MIPLTAAGLGLGLLDEGIDAQGVGWAVLALSVVAILWAILRLARDEGRLANAGAAPALWLEPDH